MELNLEITNKSRFFDGSTRLSEAYGWVLNLMSAKLVS
jgi:hypothetical protein